jgi:hypothetical protein
MVCEWEDGTLEIHYRGQKLSWREIEQRPAKPEPVAHEDKRSRHFTPQAARMPNHPWKRSYKDMKPLGSGAERDSFCVASTSAPP